MTTRTENCARTKLCPMTRLVVDTDNDAYREKGTYCIASDCMMWVEDSDSCGHCGLVHGGKG